MNRLLFSLLLPLVFGPVVSGSLNDAPCARAQAARPVNAASIKAGLTPEANLAGVWNADGWRFRVGHVLDTRDGCESAAAGKQTLWHSPDCTALDVEYTHLAGNDNTAPTRLADTSARFLRFRTRGDGPDFLLIERETVLKQEIEGGEGDTPDLQMLAIDVKTEVKIESKREGKPASVVQSGGYAALFPEDAPPLAVFTLRSEMPMHGSPALPLLLHTRFQGGVTRLGYHFPLQVLPVGAAFRQTFLIMQTRPDANGKVEDSPIERRRQVFDRAQRALGLDGAPPAYQATPEWGTVASTRYTLDMAAKESAVVVEVSQADLPCDLPIRVTGLQARWEAACVELPVGMTSVPLAPGALHPHTIGVQNGVGYAAVNINDKPRRLFVGHPVICDRPDVEIKITRWNPDGLAIQLRNVQSQAVPVNVRVHPRLGFGRQSVVIPPRAIVTRLLLWR